MQKINLQLWLALWGSLYRYLSGSCYEDVIFNSYYFIAVPIGKTCSMSLMIFNICIFYILFYFITDFNQVFQAKYAQSYQERHRIKCVNLRFYKCAHFLLFWLLSTLWIYHFHCYSMPFLPLYLSFHIDSLHRYPDSPHFSHFHPDSSHSHADSSHSHSSPIPHIPALILRISLNPFPNSPILGI